jgi:hypothetical protein
MAENFGLSEVRSVELFWEADVWWIRGFSGADRSGEVGGGATAADTNLSVVALSTLPTILAENSLMTTEKWRVDRDSHAISCNVAPLHEGAASVDVTPAEVDALLDLEDEWANAGIGAVTPRG